MKYIINYLATLLPLIALDAIWIGLIAKSFYANLMSNVFSKTMNITPALFFYPIYSLAVLLLAVLPAVTYGNWFDALWRGAILGLAAYSAYDLTNQATLAGWPTKMTLVDIGWGLSVTAITSLIAYFLITYFK